ncbi:hypothetical protein [Spirulina sp. 06S082]|uniref:hypothetical protein n=1 Tax=Spirulina sp. 06S082 TaxID=3110248 RepID=UPI002B1FBB09|nr:hypothetical protein [Spirulina sp. 06S082]MEA5470767.1 hypothetical protein [Spirulina sp. 06S082]
MCQFCFCFSSQEDCDRTTYLEGFTDRRPIDRNFRPGEFAQIFQTVHETIDRYLREGIPPS